MGADKMTTAWNWLLADDIRALIVDVDAGMLNWFDQIGCHCTDEDFFSQSLLDFQREGPPAFIGPLPDDVAAELAQFLHKAK
jgi:hypothetical protein